MVSNGWSWIYTYSNYSCITVTTRAAQSRWIFGSPRRSARPRTVWDLVPVLRWARWVRCSHSGTYVGPMRFLFVLENREWYPVDPPFLQCLMKCSLNKLLLIMMILNMNSTYILYSWHIIPLDDTHTGLNATEKMPEEIVSVGTSCIYYYILIYNI